MRRQARKPIAASPKAMQQTRVVTRNRGRGFGACSIGLGIRTGFATGMASAGANRASGGSSPVTCPMKR